MINLLWLLPLLGALFCLCYMVAGILVAVVSFVWLPVMLILMSVVVLYAIRDWGYFA